MAARIAVGQGPRPGCCSWTRARSRPLLKRLEAAGLLRRERDAKDQRNLALALTDEGRALRAEAERIPAGIVERLGMPIEELMALQGALTRVIAASRQALDAASGGCARSPGAER